MKAQQIRQGDVQLQPIGKLPAGCKELPAEGNRIVPAHGEVTGLRTAKLLRKDVPDDEPIIYADLLNSTPEPDGTTRRYMLRVDPNAYGGEASRNVHAAAASTWRNGDGGLTYKRWQDYAPVAES